MPLVTCGNCHTPSGNTALLVDKDVKVKKSEPAVILEVCENCQANNPKRFVPVPKPKKKATKKKATGKVKEAAKKAVKKATKKK